MLLKFLNHPEVIVMPQISAVKISSSLEEQLPEKGTVLKMTFCQGYIQKDFYTCL